MRQGEAEKHIATISRTVVDAHFMFTLRNVFSGAFGKRLSTGASLTALYAKIVHCA